MEITASPDEHRSWAKTTIAIAVSIYFLWCASNYTSWHFLDNVNLIIHEAGHWIFYPFGQFLNVLGGSLTQILIPTIFFGYFFFKKQWFEAGLLLFWVGESLLNVTRYLADAVVMQLPLLGGETTLHDWHWILGNLGLLNRTDTIAAVFWIFATAIIMVGCYLSIWHAAKNDT
jgi:hypothetical protein